MSKSRRPEFPAPIPFGANDLDLRLTDGGELTHTYAAEGGVKMTKQEIIAGDHRAGFDPVERDTVFNRLEKIAAWRRS